MYDFGLFEIDPRVASPDLVARAGQLEPKYFRGAAADPAAFAAAVSRAAHERGSGATYGGMRLVNSLVGRDAPGSSDVFEMAFGFLRSRHINFFYLSPVEIDWWVRNHPGEDYLSPRPLPPRPFTITPLADGERRRLVNLGHTVTTTRYTPSPAMADSTRSFSTQARTGEMPEPRNRESPSNSSTNVWVKS